jgi:hypothetical protein
MWSIAQPPLNYFEEQYDVQADERGLRHARLGTVRLPNCSGALVSSKGLVLTAARCVRPFLSMDSDSARAASFRARTPGRERPLPGLYAERVVEVNDVTAQVNSSQEGGRTQVQEQLREKAPADHRVEVVPEGGGTRFVAYTYRRIEDVRLAFLPDRAVTVLGRLGEPLTYPQHAWDVAVLRLFTDDTPLQTPQHFEVRTQGTRPGDAVFAVGHPSTTQRNETHHQLAFRRDVQLPARIAALETWATQLEQYIDTASSSGPWAEQLSEGRAALRHARARLEALQNEFVMARLQEQDNQLQQGQATDTTKKTEADELLDRLAALQDEKRDFTDRYQAFWMLMHPEQSSSTLRRALIAYRAQNEELSSMAVDSVLESIPRQPLSLDAAALAAHVERLREFLGTDSTLMRTLDDLGPAKSLVDASRFSDAEKARTNIQKGKLPEDDPAIKLVSAFYDQYASFFDDWSSLIRKEKQLTDSLARLRHRVADRPVALAKNRALRIADGRIQGYPYNGTVAPSFTTFYGLYGQHYAARRTQETMLPNRWQSPPASFERSAPLVTAASTDVGGGAYGGPLLNTSLQLVGIVFDGNVQSAAGEYLFLPRRMRTVAVDVRGVLEGLSSLYDANRLVQEMTGEPGSQ